jgi:GTPase SAR1 family protein
MAKNYMSDIDGFCLVIDLSNADSLRNLKYWVFMIQNYVSDKAPILLIGNKTDTRVLDQSQVSEICHELDLPYVECSAKTASKVSDTFESLVRWVMMINPGYKEKLQNAPPCLIPRKSGPRISEDTSLKMPTEFEEASDPDQAYMNYTDDSFHEFAGAS